MEPAPKHPWMARLVIGISMLIIAFLGLIVTDIRKTGGWLYWRWSIPFIAVLALWLSWYLRRQKSSLSAVALWHEVLHWIGLIASVIIVSIFVQIGIVGRFEAALCTLTLLALAVYLAGIYIETTFLYVGIVLGLFTLGIAFIAEYLYAVAIPLLLIGGGIIVWLIWHTRRKSTPKSPVDSE